MADFSNNNEIFTKDANLDMVQIFTKDANLDMVQTGKI